MVVSLNSRLERNKEEEEPPVYGVGVRERERERRERGRESEGEAAAQTLGYVLKKKKKKHLIGRLPLRVRRGGRDRSLEVCLLGLQLFEKLVLRFEV